MAAASDSGNARTPAFDGRAAPVAGQNDRPPQAAPTISLPKGGGAIRGIGEKFSANPVTGTGSLSVPIAMPPGRSGFGPQLSLHYNSGSGNGAYGIGIGISSPTIDRKTELGLPQYLDQIESDVFILSSSEDLVPVLNPDLTRFEDTSSAPGYTIHRYRPRIEGLFARIERWTSSDRSEVFWRSISKDNITTWYGKTGASRIADPGDSTHIFSWLICESYDDKGNAILYQYVEEDSRNVDLLLANEANRTPGSRSNNRYLKRILYGNRTPNRDQVSWLPTDLSPIPDSDWLFQVVLDYDDGHLVSLPLNLAIPEAEQHRYVTCTATATTDWPVRLDPFSTYRAGFEVRTYRRVARILCFHNFAELGIQPCLVRSTDLEYDDFDYSTPYAVADEAAYPGSTRTGSVLRRVIQAGYVYAPTTAEPTRYLRKELPPLEFEYTRPIIDPTVHDVAGIENLPGGVDGSTYQWLDLDGEGLPGALTLQAGAMYYKRNVSAIPVINPDGSSSVTAHFEPLELIPTLPSSTATAGARVQFLDLSGGATVEAVEFDGPTPGFFERGPEGDWSPFQSFGSLPTIDWKDPNLRFVDVTGDGRADVVITEVGAFRWYPSLGQDGFEESQQVPWEADDELGPRLVFSDGTETIFLADLSGDGLSDLVRIGNGGASYYPALGYCRWGSRVAMDNAPWFDSADDFDPGRLRLADIDGSGTTDLIYLGAEQIDIYRNQCGNRWTDRESLTAFPATNDSSIVQAIDLLGSGTACLVWSSPLGADLSRPMKYVDLMGGQKPHLLVASVNNLGAETRITYAPSTKFYLMDKAAGRPWVTKLPFPVHVVERVETYDRISRNRFVTRYTMHHGHYSGPDREFRGFAFVEQLDTEAFASLNAGGKDPTVSNEDPVSNVPPVLTKTWFHTGLYDEVNEVSQHLAAEYYGAPDKSDPNYNTLFAAFTQSLLPDTVIPPGLSIAEERELCRALKGSMLRQEVSALDGSAKEPHPYTVVEQNFTIEPVQSLAANRHAVFFTHARESISYHFERELHSDPRVGHALTLEVDHFGNVLKSASIGYGRAPGMSPLAGDDRTRQETTLITYTENRVTKDSVTGSDAIDGIADYRTPLPAESRTFEVTGLLPSGTGPRFSFQDVLSAGALAATLAYEQQPTPGTLEKRLIEHARTYYRANDLTGPLPLGGIQSLALPSESFRLALTPGLITAVYGARVADPMLTSNGGYVHTEGDTNWWIPSGKIFYSGDPLATPAQELGHARAHFFLPFRYRDPFHTPAVSTESFVTFDVYDLMVEETRDALGNRVTAGERDPDPTKPLLLRTQDYRVLQPVQVMDPNRNRTSVAFDAMGMVVGTAVLGKPAPNTEEGDSLNGFTADITQGEIEQFLADPKGPIAGTLLANATTRAIYDLMAYSREPDPSKKPPAVAAMLAREMHVSDLGAGQGAKIQVSLSYSDGFGREIQKKIQAEPGPAPLRDGAGRIIFGTDGQPQMTPTDISPRWSVGGVVVWNNKGKPVRQYESSFTDTHRFELEVRIGVSSVLFYDPVERVVATLHPNHAWEKFVFDPWRQETWDVNDTVLVPDPRADADAGDFFNRLASAEYTPTWYALRTDPGYAAIVAQRWPDPRTRDAEGRAADKASVHAATPAVVHADSLGRTLLTVAHNRYKYTDTPPAAPPVDEFQATRIILDIEGNQREIIDANDRVVMRYEYDMLGNRAHQASMEAGERWMLNDISGKPLYAWDSRDHRFRTNYDSLRRPTDFMLSVGGGAEVIVARSIYGESHPNPEVGNLRGKMVELRDQAGVVTSDEYDFKGNLDRSNRRLAQSYQMTLDWSGVVPLALETYTSRTRYDALNRPIQLIAPHSDQAGATVNVIQSSFNEANQLEQVHAWLSRNAEPAALLDPATANLPAVTNIDYDAKGQRILLDRGTQDGKVIRTNYAYDNETFRLTELYTRRGVDPLSGNGVAFTDDCDNSNPAPPTIAAPEKPPPGTSCGMQNLHYSYDPAGNITEIRDDAQQTIYFKNKRVEPSAEYTYDAIYRLIEATGREHLGQVGGAPSPHSYNDAPRVGLQHPGDGMAMGRYLERYVYDVVGNFLTMQHRGTDPANAGWNRAYLFGEASTLEPGKQSNRLTSTTIGATTDTFSTGGNGYDAHGNTLRMPHLQVMRWDFKDQLQMTQRLAVDAADADGLLHQSERTWYVYDSTGERVRKITEWAAGGVKDERIYLGGFEIYRDNGGNPLVRETLHVMDDKQRIALVETRTQGNEPGMPPQLIRYQFGNHLGSASLELDFASQVVSYEEWTPYNSTSFQARRNQAETPNRYRATAKERDEESGLYYHGARYYAPWIGRWTSCDSNVSENLYDYGKQNPIFWYDPSGNADKPWYSRAATAVSKGVSSTWKDAVEGSRIINKAVTKGAGAAGDWVQDRAEAGAASLKDSGHPWLAKGLSAAGVGGAFLTATTTEVVGQVLAVGPNLVLGLDSAGTNIGEGAARISLAKNSEETWLGVAQVSGGVGEAALVTVGVLSLGEGAAIRPRANTAPGMTRAQLNRAVREQFTRFEGQVTKDSTSVLTRTAEQVTIDPFTGPVTPGSPLPPTAREVIIDTVEQSRVTGNTSLIDAKSSSTAGLTPNQTVGYPLLEQFGGRVRGAAGGSVLPAGTIIPPTGVQLVRPGGLIAKKALQAATSITTDTEVVRR